MNRDAPAPERTVITEPLVERERASATPAMRGPHGIRGPAAPDLAFPSPPLRKRDGPESATLGAEAASTGATLRARQVWFANAILSPAPALEVAGRDADVILTAGPRLSPFDRLRVYHRAYTARLVECLADDYPALCTALGEERFEALCRGYIERHPSTSPSLNAYGRRMAEFCREGMDPKLAEQCCAAAEPGFMADLASLEWAIVDVIHAESVDPLTPSGLADVPVERWSDARLETTPAFRLLRFAYPVNTYLQALRSGQAPSIPGRARSGAAVYRSGATIWRMDLTEPMCDVLEALASGETLGASLERAAGALSEFAEDVAIRRVMDWFREWVSSGLFSGVTFD